MIININSNTLLAVAGIVIPLAGRIIAAGILEIARWWRWSSIWNGRPQRGFLFEPSTGGILKSLRKKQITKDMTYTSTVTFLLITVPLLNLGKNLLLKPTDCSSTLISGLALCVQDAAHSSPEPYVAPAAKLILSGSHNTGQFSWVIGNHAKWINIRPFGNHSQPLSTVTCNSTLTLSTQSNLTARRLTGPSAPNPGDFIKYQIFLPNSPIVIPGQNEGDSGGSFQSMPVAPGSISYNSSGQVWSTLGPATFWYDIGVDGGRCNAAEGTCTYIYRQSILAFNNDAQAIMANRTTFGDTTVGVQLNGTLTTKSLECTSTFATEWVTSGNYSLPFNIGTMINHVGTFVTVLGALNNGRSFPSEPDNFQSTFDFDERVVKSVMLADHMSYSAQCDAQYYITRQCTEAPLWLIIIIGVFLGTSILFIFGLSLFFCLRPSLTEIQTPRGKYVTSRYPVSAWEWYCEWCKQNRANTSTQATDSKTQSPTVSDHAVSDHADDYVLCVTQHDNVQAIGFDTRDQAVARIQVLPLL